MLRERECPECRTPVVMVNFRWRDRDGAGPHWCPRIEAGPTDIIECVCGAVVWRDHQGAKTDMTTGEPHSHRAAALGNQSPRSRAVVVEEQAAGGAMPPPPVAGRPNGRARPVVGLDL